MISKESSLAENTNAEIPALIETLLATEQRLEDLTDGQIDSVAGRDGRTFVLRRAQDQLRHNEAVKQSAILNALPAHIALLDGQGFIISVNEAWRCFADANALDAPGHGVGLNYLAICEQAQGDYSAESHQIAAGIRSVLDRREHSFSIEYPCHSPAEPRWFLMTVSPLAQDHPNGAVVMHLNITERRWTEQALHDGEERLHFLDDLAEASRTLADPEQIMAVMSRMLGEHLRASRCAYADVEQDGEQFTIRHDYTDGCASTAGSYQLSTFGPRAVSTLRSGKTLIIRDVVAELLPDEGMDMFNVIGIKAIITCPLIKAGHLRAMMAVHQMTPRDWTLSEISLVHEVAERCWATIERRRAEATLRESEAGFRALAEAMPQMVWIARPDGWNIYLSQQWMDYTGLTLEESMGHGWNKPFHPEDQQRAWDAWERATATNGVYSIESRLRRADGVYRWWLIRGVPQQDTEGNINKWFGTCTDIQELKQAELEISRTNEALQESSEKFHQLANNISDVFWITSPDLNTIHYVSPGYDLIWGRSAASLYANPQQWVETIIPEERENVFAVFAELMGTAPEVSVEYRIARPDGSVRWIYDRGFQVRDASGKLVRLTGVSSDITERKGLEAELRQAQKLEAIGTLAGGIAHDFNNILAAIMGYTELAQKGLSPNGRPHAQLAQVLKASGRARDLVQQILTFSRRDEYEQQPLRVQDILEETLDLIRASLPTTIEIRRTIDHAVPRILGDDTQIQQVIMNLCLNAGHAMKEGNGILSISLTSPDIGARFREAHPELGEGPHVLLSISDTGCGIDRAAQTRIFDPFYTTKAPGEGTGLGLAVVHGVVKNHDGIITVQSEVGGGSTFSIYLPVCEPPAGAVVQDAVNIPRGNGEHILFVDDEEALASMGKLMLEDLGYRVTAKTDSVESLEAFRSEPEAFDLVVTDQTMPHLNGADLATALLEIRPALPVILLTGYSSAISPEMAKAIGIGELLLKPCPMHVLEEAIQRALGSRQKNEHQHPVDRR